jgi:hypothetical protein
MTLPDLSTTDIPAILWTLVVMSVFVERVLSLVFEHRAYLQYLDGRGLKELISFLVSLVACHQYGFDALALLMGKTEGNWVGLMLTAGVVAGGSKASIGMFHQLLNVRSAAAKEQAVIREERIVRMKVEQGVSDEKKTGEPRG